MFIGAHWAKLSLAAACLFAFTTFKGCSANADLSARLAACEAKPPVVQVQTVTVKQKCAGTATVEPVPGSPCPKVALTFDGSTDTAVSQTQTAQAATPCPTVSDLGLWVGGGYLGTPYLSAGLQYKAWQVDAKRSLVEWGGGVRYRLLAF